MVSEIITIKTDWLCYQLILVSEAKTSRVGVFIVPPLFLISENWLFCTSTKVNHATRVTAQQLKNQSVFTVN